jgi:hypothetical protein
MTGKPQASFWEILAEMGQLIFDWCRQMPWVVILVMAAWIIPPLGALITTLLAIHIYRHQESVSISPTNITSSLSGENQNKTYFILGILSIALGLFWLIRYLTHFDLPWSILLIVLGALLVAIGIGTGRRRRDDEQRKAS